MIALQRDRSAAAVPAAFRAASLAAKARKLIDLYYAAQAPGGKWVFDSAAWKPAKAQLKREAHGKCAYCEGTSETVAHGDVEHFRPKSKYWWLAFCYDNYLHSCQICNQTHKSDNFPAAPMLTAPVMPAAKPPPGPALDALVAQLTVDALAMSDPQVTALWATEVADLVNPYFEDPAPLFAYEYDEPNRWVWVRAGPGPRAQRVLAAAEAFLGINRPELLRARGAQFATLGVAKAALDTGQPAVVPFATQLVQELQRPNQPFAGMARWFAAQWGLPGPPP